MKSFSQIVGAMLVSLFLTSPCHSQVQSRLIGTVADSTGAIIVGATIAVRNVATGVRNEAVSNESGVYLFPVLPPGNYEVTCEHPGFKRFERAGVLLETGYTRTVDIELEVGALTETVVVEATAPLLQSEDATVGQLIERQAVLNMPLESRRAGSLIRLMGNVVYRDEGNNDLSPVFSVAGGRGMNQMWQMDGGVVQNMALGNPGLLLNPPSETIQEYKVEANNYSAEFGRAGGGLILMTTRSGTNEFHGALYEFLRNDKLDARSFFAPGKAPFRFNIFGGSLGGPIVRDRTHFFFNYEGSRRRDGTTISNYDVPHPSEINGDFSNRVDFTLMDPVAAAPFSNNVIPQTRIDPVAHRFAQLWPAPNVTDNDITRAPRDNFVANASDKVNADFYTARVDHIISNNHRIFGRYNYIDNPEERFGVYTNAWADPRARTLEKHQHRALVAWMQTFKPTLFGEFRYGFGQRFFQNKGGAHGLGKNAEFGFTGVDDDSLARISASGLTNIGQGQNLRVQDKIRTQQLIYNLTWIKGGHQLKVGAEMRTSQNRDDDNESGGGTLSFNDRATDNGLAALLLGRPASAARLHVNLLTTASTFYGAYLQDDWKVTPNFTLNLGLRWDMDTPVWEKNNQLSSFDPEKINPVAGIPGAMTFAGLDGRNKYAHEFDKNNFGPRFGFAYRPGQGLVLRGGYGIQYLGAYIHQVVTRVSQSFSLDVSLSSPDGGFTPVFLVQNGFPQVPQEEPWAGFGAVPIGEAPRFSPRFFLPDHQNGYMQQWNLGIQKELTGNMLFELAYLANVGHKLGSDVVSMNMIPLVNGRGPARQDQLLRPFPHFNHVQILLPSWGNSSYHSMNTKLEKRYSNGLNFLMNYTWSKMLDDVESRSELGGAPGFEYTHIELRGKPNKSYSGWDVRHRYIGSTVYELPFGRGRRWDIQNPVLNGFAGGWGIGGILEVRSGVPYGVVEQTNRTNTFSAGVRPNILNDPLLPSDRSRDAVLAEYFDTSAFVAPAVGEFGNAARTYCCGPGLFRFDLSVHKQFPINERVKILFRTDFLNLPNSPVFANPATTRGSGDFGRISSTLGGTAGRQIQFNMRLEF